MIERILEITNIGTFYHWKPESPPILRKLTLIYGPNGTGKTTLCAILRSLARNDPDILKGRKTLGGEGETRVEIKLDNGEGCIWDGTRWSGTPPKIEIFDEQFVRDNLYTDVVEIEHQRNLHRVIIGEEAAKIADQIARLDSEGRKIQGNLTSLEKTLQSHASGMKLTDFFKLANNPSVEMEITNQELLIRSLEDAEKIANGQLLQRLELPSMPQGVEELLSRTLDCVAEDAERAVMQHLELHGSLDREWLQRGLNHIENDECPFCGQRIAGVQLVEAYRTVFSQAYQELKRTVQERLRQLRELFGRTSAEKLAKTLAESKASLAFWKTYVGEAVEQVRDPVDWRNAWDAHHDTAVAALEAKANNPLEPVPTEAVAAAASALTKALGALAEYDREIASLNKIIKGRKQDVSTVQLAEAKNRLQRLKLTRVRHQPDVTSLYNEYQGKLVEKKQIEAQKENLRKSLENRVAELAKSCESRVNELLGLFNAGFRLMNISAHNTGGPPALGWQIAIREKAVDLRHAKTHPSQPSFKNTLSAGDRSALAFAFFIAQLELKPDRAERIVVFDDPYSSLDRFRRWNTNRIILDTLKPISQMIVLSHNEDFLRQVDLKTDSKTKCILEVVEGEESGARLVEGYEIRPTMVFWLDELNQIRDYVDKGEGTPFDVGRQLRPVLESAFRYMFPKKISAKDNLGAIIGKIKNWGGEWGSTADDMKNIEDYTNKLHHGGDSATGHVENLEPEELKAFARRVLNIVKVAEERRDR